MRCQACGYQSAASAGRCPRCGFAPQTGSVTPLPEPPQQLRQPADGVLQPPPRGAGRRTWLVAGVVSIVVVLVGAAATAAVRALLPAAAPAGEASAGSALLTASGNPPGTAGNWRSGIRRAWRTRAVHDSLSSNEVRDYFNGYSTRTGAAWALTDLVGDVTFDVWALDPSNGDILWGHGGNLHCAEDQIGGLVPCLDSRQVRGSDTYQDVLALMEWRSGEEKVVTPLADLGIEHGSPTPDVSVVQDAIILTLPSWDHADAGMLSGLRDVITARISPDGTKARWVSSSQGCEECAAGASRALSVAANLQHGVLSTSYGAAYDFETGRPVFAGSTLAIPVADGVFDLLNEEPDATSAVAPDGSTLRFTREMPGWALVDRLPPTPLRVTTLLQGEESAIAQLSAFDPATGTAAWTSPLDLAIRTMPLSVGSLSYDGARLIVLAENTLAALDPATGEVLWNKPVDPGWYALSRTADGTVLAGTYDETTAFDPETGTKLWDVDGEVAPAADSDGNEYLLLLGGYRENAQPYVAALIPADRATKAHRLPDGAPQCPPGMTPVAWTRYEDGGILLCRLGAQYSVISPGHPEWRASELTFADPGYEVVFDGGVRVRVSLGGAVVYEEANGTTTVHSASQVWTDASGATSLRAPADLKACPPGSWPISLSVFDGGWLLVCGTSSGMPGSMTLSEGGSVDDAADVGHVGGAYCGTVQGRRVCAYRAPAVVTEEANDNTTAQRSVTSNYFSGHGEGGAGEGTGSYGVETPDDTAADQARYLAQVLQKSHAGRSDLDRAVALVRRCQNLTGAITTLRNVTANREELLDALDSAPVDAVPDGAALVSRLRRALQLSRDSDLVWEQWAESENLSGCALGEGNPLYAQVTRMNRDVAVAKDTFLDDWNSTIAPAFDLPQFTRSGI